MVKFNIQLFIFLANFYSLNIVDSFLFWITAFLTCSCDSISQLIPPKCQGVSGFFLQPFCHSMLFLWMMSPNHMSSIAICVINDPKIWISLLNPSLDLQILTPPGLASQMLYSCSSSMSSESNTPTNMSLKSLNPFHAPLFLDSVGDSFASRLSKKADL